MPPTDVDMPQVVATLKPNPRNNATMFKIFQNVQYNVVQHKKYVKEMTKLYKKLDQDSFRESFKNALQYLFTFGDTSANVDRVIQFVATFCTTLDDEEEFLLFIFEIIFDCQCVSGQSVRYRASQLLAAVLSALGDDASLDDDLCDKLLASQMQRLQDTRGAVRCRAALALQRLQNPMEPDDEVTRAYRFHMSCDPSSSVRRAVVMSIAKCTRNVPFVLERLCDVDEAVRRAAFLYIAAVNVTQLRVRQRVLTLKVGLTERSMRVRRVVEEILLPGWLSTFQGNIVLLLKAIRLDNAHDAKDSQYVAGKLLDSLFKRLSVSELLEWLPTDKTLRLIPAEKLNKETAWYWRHLAEHFQKIDDDETLETILPDLVVLTGYIRAIIESSCPEGEAANARLHVLAQLGHLLRVYDHAEPTGAKAARALVTDLLTGDYGYLSPEVISAYVSALELIVPEISPRMEVISGVISALRDPPEVEAPPPPPPPTQDCQKIKLQRARLRVSLNVAIEAQEEAVRDQNYALAAECKAKVEDIQKQLEDLSVQPAPPPPPPVAISTIKEKLSDADTLNKCLLILNSALDTPQLTTITPMLQMIFNELEVDIFQNPDILENALVTVGLYGMLDKDFARDNKAFFFAHLIDTSNERIVSIVLRCIVDLLCVHGARVFEDESNESRNETVRSRKSLHNTIDAMDDEGNLSESALSMSPAHSTVIELLLKIMDSTCAAYRLIIVEGLCRLIHLGHLESPSILSRLILLWFNPATVDEDMLRQIIGVFFQTFPVSVDGAQEQIQKATIPTLRALANAPSSSPIAEIDQEAVVRFIVSLTKVNYELIDSQGAMALTLCNFISRHPTASCAGLLCRLLAFLQAPRDTALAGLLAKGLAGALQKLPDKQSCRNLTRYLGTLEAAERTSLNKISTTGVTEGTLQAEDTMPHLGRSTSSLPQPLARSTHVIINETVEEEVEIDETSPTETISKISEVLPDRKESASPKSVRTSSEQEADKDVPSDNSSDVSPVKKAKITKGTKKKKLSITRKSSETEAKPARKQKQKEKSIPDKSSPETNTQILEAKNSKNKADKKDAEEKSKPEEIEIGGVKRSRSQRSLVDVERAQKAKAEKTKPKPPSPLEDLDVSNVTIRRSAARAQASRGDGQKNGKNGKKKDTAPARVTRSSSSRSSAGSVRESLDNSADETELHTIVYDNENAQSLLEDSNDFTTTKANVTIPETPDASEDSASEPEPEVKSKGKRNGRKKIK